MERDNLIHAVAFRSSGCWVAQCLEYDIATQAESLSDLLHEVDRILAAHLLVAREEGVEPFANIAKAPRRFWEMYKNGKPLTVATPLQLSLPAEERPKIELALVA